MPGNGVSFVPGFGTRCPALSSRRQEHVRGHKGSFVAKRLLHVKERKEGKERKERPERRKRGKRGGKRARGKQEPRERQASKRLASKRELVRTWRGLYTP